MPGIPWCPCLVFCLESVSSCGRRSVRFGAQRWQWHRWHRLQQQRERKTRWRAWDPTYILPTLVYNDMYCTVWCTCFLHAGSTALTIHIIHQRLWKVLELPPEWCRCFKVCQLRFCFLLLFSWEKKTHTSHNVRTFSQVVISKNA